jgi:hypothetical protein
MVVFRTEGVREWKKRRMGAPLCFRFKQKLPAATKEPALKGGFEPSTGGSAQIRQYPECLR